MASDIPVFTTMQPQDFFSEQLMLVILFGVSAGVLLFSVVRWSCCCSCCATCGCRVGSWDWCGACKETKKQMQYETVSTTDLHAVYERSFAHLTYRARHTFDMVMQALNQLGHMFFSLQKIGWNRDLSTVSYISSYNMLFGAVPAMEILVGCRIGTGLPLQYRSTSRVWRYFFSNYAQMILFLGFGLAYTVMFALMSFCSHTDPTTCYVSGSTSNPWPGLYQAFTIIMGGYYALMLFCFSFECWSYHIKSTHYKQELTSWLLAMQLIFNVLKALAYLTMTVLLYLTYGMQRPSDLDVPFAETTTLLDDFFIAIMYIQLSLGYVSIIHTMFFATGVQINTNGNPPPVKPPQQAHATATIAVYDQSTDNFAE